MPPSPWLGSWLLAQYFMLTVTQRLYSVDTAVPQESLKHAQISLYTVEDLAFMFWAMFSPYNVNLYMTVHTAQLRTFLLCSVPVLCWQIHTTVRRFHLTNWNNGATSVALSKHRHWLHALAAFERLSLIREIGQCFLQQDPGGWHKWD